MIRGTRSRETIKTIVLKLLLVLPVIFLVSVATFLMT
jgi:hypothetical protein